MVKGCSIEDEKSHAAFEVLRGFFGAGMKGAERVWRSALSVF